MSQTDEYTAALICQMHTVRRCTVFALNGNGDVIERIIPLFLANTRMLAADVFQMVEHISVGHALPEVAALAFFWRHDYAVSVAVVAPDGTGTEQSYRHDPIDVLAFDGGLTTNSVFMLASSCATVTAFRFATEMTSQ
tara:strand:+ start:90 stop:503 length:414 start_codon:yes stop_codon:yes gene_type:complete